jgi:multidrug efflux system membrane fusion protein
MMASKPSLLTAAVIALLAGGWLLSGQFLKEDGARKLKSQYQSKTIFRNKTKVRIRNFQAQNYIPSIRITGQTESSRSLIIRTQISGRIAKIKAPNGTRITKGSIIVELYPEDWPLRLKEAKARVRHREIQFSAAKKLALKGFKSETNYAAAFADLQSAKVHEKRIEIDYESTVIRAPFSGILTNRHVEIGDVLKKSDPIANLIDLTPLLITAFVSERNYLKLKKGQSARGRLINGKEINGKIRYISPIAQKDTRTFKVELEIANSKTSIAEGITAELIIPMPPVLSHQLSAALFSLGANGELGIKIVSQESKVQFIPVKIIGGTSKKVFVTGLPDHCNIIIVGQGFVIHDEVVEGVTEINAQGPS